MYPMDGSAPDNFSGVDYAALVSAAQIYDERKLEGQVAKVVEDFFESRGVPTRRCLIGGLGAAAGGPWMDVYLWVQENWEALQKIASAAIGFALGVTAKWRAVRKKLDNKVLDRHVPTVVLELGARTKGTGPGLDGEASRSFNSLLRLVPALDESLRTQFPSQKFSVRVLGASEQNAGRYALFKAGGITDSDVARVLRYFGKIERQPDTGTVLLYRQFGFITRLRRARGLSESTSLMMGTNP